MRNKGREWVYKIWIETIYRIDGILSFVCTATSFVFTIDILNRLSGVHVCSCSAIIFILYVVFLLKDFVFEFVITSTI